MEHIRAFTHTGRAWYGKACLEKAKHADEVGFGMYDADGGTSGEMTMRWYLFSNKHNGGELSPRLECFNDAFAVLATMPDLIAALGRLNGQDFTPAQFCALLVELGFTDQTQEEYGKQCATNATK